MNIEIPDNIYTKEDIEKAFDMGYYAAVEEFERLIDQLHDMQKGLLQSMKDMPQEEGIAQ